MVSLTHPKCVRNCCKSIRIVLRRDKMPMKVHLKKKQRGLTLTLSFIVISDQFGQEVTAESINVKDLAWLRFKFNFAEQNNEYVLKSTMSFAEHENAEDSTVEINLSCNEFEKQCICSHYYDTVYINPKKHDFCIDGIIVASLEVTVIVRKVTKPSPINKLFEDTAFTDFQLCATDGSIAVHKSLLSVYSDMFKTMLGGEWKETSEGLIKIPGVTAQTLQHLKEYMYLETLPDEGLEPLLLLAVHYLMDTLRADCITKLVKRVRPDDVHGLIKFACENNLPDLMKATLLEIRNTIVNDMYNTIYK